MAKFLRVYGWLGRADRPQPSRPWVTQTREICAAPSKAAVARIAGVARPSQLFNLSETGNAEEIEQAMSAPGAIFWQYIDDRGAWSKRQGGRDAER